MAISDVIAHIDADILKLQQAKLVLMGGSPAAPAPAPAAAVAAAPVKSGRRGRPKGSKNSKAVEAKAPVAVKSPAAVKAPAATKVAAKTTKRKLSPEGRKAIADAMKRRWAERRKQAVK